MLLTEELFTKFVFHDTKMGLLLVISFFNLTMHVCERIEWTEILELLTIYHFTGKSRIRDLEIQIQSQDWIPFPCAAIRIFKL